MKNKNIIIYECIHFLIEFNIERNAIRKITKQGWSIGLTEITKSTDNSVRQQVFGAPPPVKQNARFVLDTF